jgi:putative flippase GtrA
MTVTLRRPSDSILRLMRFGIVGLTAGLIHSGLFLLLVNKFGFPGWLGNITAFSIAFVVSYVGQSRWTFGAEHTSRRLVCYLATQLAALALNTGIATLIVDVAHLPAILFLPFPIVVIPVMTFVLMRLWVFRLKSV